MASIRPRKTETGERRYDVRWREGGRERSKSHIRLADAKRQRAAVESRHRLGDLYVAPPDSFQAAEEEWYARYLVGLESRTKPKAASVASVNESRAHLAPLRGLRVDLVDLVELERLVLPIAKVSPRRAEMVLRLAKRILRSAQRRRQPIDASALAAELAPAAARAPVFLAWDQVETLQSWLPEFICRIAPVAVLTLCRVSELLGLRDDDLDLETGSVAVYEQLQRGGRAATKTAAGRRVVDIGPLAARLLREQQLVRAPNDQRLLFPTKTGRPFDRKRFYGRYFVPAAVAAGLGSFSEIEGRRHYEGLTFHDLRHTGASLMIAAGCNVKAIAEQIGHADGGALVLRRYGHLYKGAQKAAALALENHVLAAAAASDVAAVRDGVSR